MAHCASALHSFRAWPCGASFVTNLQCHRICLVSRSICSLPNYVWRRKPIQTLCIMGRFGYELLISTSLSTAQQRNQTFEASFLLCGAAKNTRMFSNVYFFYFTTFELLKIKLNFEPGTGTGGPLGIRKRFIYRNLVACPEKVRAQHCLGIVWVCTYRILKEN